MATSRPEVSSARELLKARSRAAVLRIARATGLTASHYPSYNSLEFLLDKVIAQLSINCVLDVGAFHGRYIELLRRDVKYPGPICSFEPASASWLVLKQSHGHDPQWSGRHCALGKTEGEVTLNLYGKGDLNSMLQPSEYGTSQFVALRERGQTETVPLHRLDNIFGNVTRGMAHPRVLLKIDTQGGDMDVIEGATSVLPHIHALQIELSAQPIYDGQPTLDVVPQIAALGFDLAGLFPVTRDRKDGLRVIEFDAVFVKV